MTRHGQRASWYLVLLTAFILILLPAGCGDQQGDGPPVRSTETGSVVLNIQWYTDRETAGTQPMQADHLDCDGEGVATVTVQVYDENSKWLKNEDWPCADHGGTISGILAGEDRRFVALAEDADGNTLLRGERTGISIVAGQITPAVDIPAHRFVTQLNAPADEAKVELNDFSLEWEAVEAAEQYQVLVATDDTFDDDQIVIDTTTTETSYAPTGLAPSTRYCWRIHALDAQQNPSAAPEQRWFTTSAHANERPSATITAPEANAVFTQGETITFTGSAQDSEEGPLIGSALVWISNIDGSIGSGTTFTRDDLSLGTHTITLTATDSQGASGSDTVRISILPPDSDCHPPVLDPIGNRNVVEGQELSFIVSASDPDEGDQLTFRADRSNLPDAADVAFDPDTGEFSWNTVSGEAGDYLVTFEVCDDCPDGALCDDEQITITVGSCSYTIDPEEEDFPRAGGEGTIEVIASDPACEWSAAENVDWIEITSGGTGTGSGTVRYTVSANPGASRSTDIVVAGVTHSVSQDAADCTFTIDPPNRPNVPYGGETYTIAVDALREDCPWTASEGAGWISITPTSDTGDGEVRVTVQANTTGNERNATITVAGIAHRVTQAPLPSCTFTIDPPNRLNVPYGRTTYDIEVHPSRQDCRWEASEDATWISIEPTGGTGDGAVHVTVSANSGPEREDTITVAGIAHRVTQVAGPCTFWIDPESQDVSASLVRYTVDVHVTHEECAWTTSEEISWIGLTPTRGTGEDSVLVTVAANSGASRDATITIAGQPHEVHQAAAPCDYDVFIGDNDGYGYGASIVPDNATLPYADPEDQYCFGSGNCSLYDDAYSCNSASGCEWVTFAFDNREPSEESASDGSQYTDLEPPRSPTSFTIRFCPVDSSDFYRAEFTFDVSGIQTERWGPSTLTLDDEDFSYALPAEQGAFGSTRHTIYIYDAGHFTDGELTVHFVPGSYDFVAFDFFRLRIIRD